MAEPNGIDAVTAPIEAEVAAAVKNADRKEVVEDPSAFTNIRADGFTINGITGEVTPALVSFDEVSRKGGSYDNITGDSSKAIVRLHAKANTTFKAVHDVEIDADHRVRILYQVQYTHVTSPQRPLFMNVNVGNRMAVPYYRVSASNRSHEPTFRVCARPPDPINISDNFQEQYKHLRSDISSLSHESSRMHRYANALVPGVGSSAQWTNFVITKLLGVIKSGNADAFLIKGHLYKMARLANDSNTMPNFHFVAGGPHDDYLQTPPLVYPWTIRNDQIHQEPPWSVNLIDYQHGRKVVFPDHTPMTSNILGTLYLLALPYPMFQLVSADRRHVFVSSNVQIFGSRPENINFINDYAFQEFAPMVQGGRGGRFPIPQNVPEIDALNASMEWIVRHMNLPDDVMSTTFFAALQMVYYHSNDAGPYSGHIRIDHPKGPDNQTHDGLQDPAMLIVDAVDGPDANDEVNFWGRAAVSDRNDAVNVPPVNLYPPMVRVPAAEDPPQPERRRYPLRNQNPDFVDSRASSVAREEQPVPVPQKRNRRALVTSRARNPVVDRRDLRDDEEPTETDKKKKKEVEQSKSVYQNKGVHWCREVPTTVAFHLASISSPNTARMLLTALEVQRSQSSDRIIAKTHLMNMDFSTFVNMLNVWGRSFCYALGMYDIRFNFSSSDHFFHQNSIFQNGAPWESTSAGGTIYSNGLIPPENRIDEMTVAQTQLQSNQIVLTGICTPDSMFYTLVGRADPRLCDIYHRSQFEERTAFMPVTTTGVLDILVTLCEGVNFLPGPLTFTPSVASFFSTSERGEFIRSSYTLSTGANNVRGAIYSGGSLKKSTAILQVCGFYEAGPAAYIYSVPHATHGDGERGEMVRIPLRADPNIRCLPREGGYLTFNHITRRGYEYVARAIFHEDVEDESPWTTIFNVLARQETPHTFNAYGVWVPALIGDTRVLPTIRTVEDATTLHHALPRKRREMAENSSGVSN